MPMPNNTNPKISVLMPVYNAEDYLAQAIESILNQTFIDFEFIIIDDGSNDKSPKIIESYKNRDSRIKFLSNSYNQGIVFTLNRGLKEAKADYISRMDADDVALPSKLEKQIQFLEKNPDIAVLGTNMIVVDQNFNIVEQTFLSSESLLIKWNLYFFCSLAHPTVMMRRSMLSEIGGYNQKFKHIEDYELWLRSSSTYKFYNLNEPLLYYRIHNANVSVTFKREQDQSFVSLLSYYISELIDEPIPSDVVAMVCFRTNNYNSEKSYALMQKIYQSFIIKNNLIFKEDKYWIRTDMYDKLLGIIKRDQNCKRKFKMLLQILKSNFFIVIFLLLAKIRKSLFKFLLGKKCNF